MDLLRCSSMPKGANPSTPEPAVSPWEQTDLLSFALQQQQQAEPEPEPEALPEPQPEPEPEAQPEPQLEPEPLSAPEPEPVAPVVAAVEEPVLEPVPAAPAAGAPRTLLILDTETTGLDPERDQCIEVGAVLFDVAHRSVLTQVSFLLPCEHNAAAAINGIPPQLTQQSQPWRVALQCFEAMVAAADLLVAHNAAFDQQWFGHGQLPALDKPWLCSMEDLRWPAERQLRSRPSVRDLALAYGVPVWTAHRALTDCIYIAQVFERCDNLEELLVAGLEPRRLYRARLSYDERHKAREAGFRWNEPVSGAWSRRLSEREASLLPFPVVPVDEPQRRSA